MPIDLSVSRDDSAPSTSGGISGGPQHIVFPDTSSSSDEDEASNRFINRKNRNLPKMFTARTVISVGGVDEVILHESTGQLLASPPANKSSPRVKNLSESSESASDLEVLDVVKARPKKVRDPEIVELSSSSDEAEDVPPIQPFQNSNEPIEISSGTDTEEDAGRAAHVYGDWGLGAHNRAIMGMGIEGIANYDEQELANSFNWEGFYDNTSSRLNQMRATDYSSRAPQGKGKKTKAPTPPPPESSDEDDLIVVRTDYNTVDPISKKEIVEPVKNKKCNHIYEKSTI